MKQRLQTPQEIYRQLTVLCGLFVMLLAVAEYLGRIFFKGDTPDFPDENGFKDSLFVFLLINLNIIILSYLIFLIIKNITKLILDRKKNILGSRLRIKLVLSFVSLSAVPTIILFLIAKGFISYFTDSYSKVIDLYRPIDSSYTLMLVSVTLLVVFLSIWIGLRIAQNISEPLKMLARGTTQVAKGNLAFKIPEIGDDELGTLITSFNTMTNNLKKANEELAAKQRMEAWQEVAKRIAHEIKNPLTPIQLCAQRLQKKFQGKLASAEQETPAQQESLDKNDLQVILDCSQTIVEQVQTLRTLVNEFSRFARMPKILLESTQLNDIILGLQKLYCQSHSNIIFDLELDPALPILNVDKEQLNRVFVNLIDNAVAAVNEYWAGLKAKFTKEVPRIILKTFYNNELGIVLITISDNGLGVPDQDKEKIFEPYVTNKRGGTGLGLAIVSSIIVNHGGFIRVKDVEPRGTAFVIELPCITSL